MNTAWLQTLMAGPSQLTPKSIASGNAPSTSNQARNSNTISAASYGIQPQVVACIQNASASTGMDFSYLMAQAARESSFDPNAKATTSSAHGLYQFVEQTWLSVFKDHGADYGYGDLASKISTDADGHMVVKDAALKKQILGLRKDPQLSAEMAAEHASDNQAIMEKKLGRQVTGTDLYLAHFLGVQGATKFLRNMKSDPTASAADLFPAAADANNAVFYKDDGSAKSVAEVYQNFGKKISADMAAFRKFQQTDDKNVVLQAQNASGGNANSGVGRATSVTTGDALVTGSPVTQMAQLFRRDTVAPQRNLIGNGAVCGQINPGGVLSPSMLMTLAGLPMIGHDSNTQKSANGTRPFWDQMNLGTFIG
jgi:hypothetical protein